SEKANGTTSNSHRTPGMIANALPKIPAFPKLSDTINLMKHDAQTYFHCTSSPVSRRTFLQWAMVSGLWLAFGMPAPARTNDPSPLLWWMDLSHDDIHSV